MSAIYYCYACGLRLRADEVDVAVNRGESHATACCDTCAKLGKRIKDPKAQEAGALNAVSHNAPVSIHNAQNPIPDDSAILAAQPGPISVPVAQPARISSSRHPRPPSSIIISGASQAARAARKTGVIAKGAVASPADPRKKEASSGKSAFPLIPVLGGAGVILIAAAVMLYSRPGSGSKLASAPVAETKKEPPGVKPAATPLTTTPQPEPPRPAALSPPKTPDDEFTTSTIDGFLRYNNFARAEERRGALEKVLPQDAAFNDLRARLVSLKIKIHGGSLAALGAMIKTAEEKAQAGDFKAQRTLMSPLRIVDLLPEHAEEAVREAEKYKDLSASIAKKEAAESAAALVELEKNFPAALGPAPKPTVLFGPEGANSKVVLKSGKESIRLPAGKIAYWDSVIKIILEFNGAAGVVNNDPFVVEYSALQDVDVLVILELQEFGKREGLVRFSAGMNQRVEINPNDDTVIFIKGKRGKATGRDLKGIVVDAPKLPPAALAIFRISR